MSWDAFFYRLIRSLAGASRFSPHQFWDQASEGARKLAQEALAPFENSPLPVVDYHAHFLGNGIGLRPPAMHKSMLTWKNPYAHLRYLTYLSAIKLSPCLSDPDGHIRRHLHELVKHLPAPSSPQRRSYRIQMLALDQYYSPEGCKLPDKTHFYVSNDYLLKFVQEYPESFTPVFSVHPYRSDALAELKRCHELFEEWRRQLVERNILNQKEASKIPKMLKWLPNGMGIDPTHPKCEPFYEKLCKYKFTLLSHTGEEIAVTVDRFHQQLGNPLLLRKPLQAGVNVIIAHCGALGQNPDLDQDGRLEDNLTLFLRMMKESLETPEKYSGKLFGDLSALAIFHCQKQFSTLLGMPEIHHRLVNGSDYPLPAINILVHLGSSKRAGLITAEEATHLREIYDYNPLLMDIVFKRTCRHPKTGGQLPEELFTRLLE